MCVGGYTAARIFVIAASVVIAAPAYAGGRGGHSSRGHSGGGHSSRGHSSRGHSGGGHSSRGHSSRGHSSRGHSSRGHSSRPHHRGATPGHSTGHYGVVDHHDVFGYGYPFGFGYGYDYGYPWGYGEVGCRSGYDVNGNYVAYGGPACVNESVVVGAGNSVYAAPGTVPAQPKLGIGLRMLSPDASDPNGVGGGLGALIRLRGNRIDTEFEIGKGTWTRGLLTSTRVGATFYANLTSGSLVPYLLAGGGVSMLEGGVGDKRAYAEGGAGLALHLSERFVLTGDVRWSTTRDLVNNQMDGVRRPLDDTSNNGRGGLATRVSVILNF